MVPRIDLSLSDIKPVGRKKGVAAPGSTAMLVANPTGVERAIIFVHGFAGHAIETWGNFQSLIVLDGRYDSSDVFFYGIRSMLHQLPVMTMDFLFFMRLLVAGAITDKTVRHDICDATPRHEYYKEIILVGHSLGGAVIRNAIILGDDAKDQWPQKSRVVLFAPAHCGARIARLGTEMSEAIKGLDILAKAARYASPIIDDLHPTDSPFLPRIRIITEERASGKSDYYPGQYKAKCVFGENERVVIADHYAHDARHVPDFEDHDHVSICKPTSGWKWPTSYVIE